MTRSDDLQFLLRTVGFSALVGIRSISPPALLSRYLARPQSLPKGAIEQRVASTPARLGLLALALGEVVADKFPQLPSRNAAPVVAFRALIGGGVSALLWSRSARPAWIGALLGAAAATATSYAIFYLRRWLGRVLPGRYASSWSGLLEDAVVWLGGWWLLRENSKPASFVAADWLTQPGKVAQQD